MHFCVLKIMNRTYSMRISFILSFALVMGCAPKKQAALKTGVWRGMIEMQGKELPFNFAIQQDSISGLNIYIKNADENLLLDEVTHVGDSLAFTLHIFDAEVRAHLDGDSMNGFFIRHDVADYKLPFKAAFNQDFRFAQYLEDEHTSMFDGKYEVTFTNESDTTPAIGIFERKSGNIITGTFLTTTGDYRYLEGNIVNDKMYLSTFDGNHLYLFTASKSSDSTLVGEYWSGKGWHQTWTGFKNPTASLPDPESLTYLKAGFYHLEFKFPNVNGNILSPNDPKYKGKVLIIQLTGTWCPNCMDETRFLSKWYDENKDRGVEIIALAYEAKDDFTYASGRVKKMIDKFNVHYDYAIAGTKDNDAASKTLPMLNEVSAFPTTIFIGKDGKVKRIHTGFNGPGTGHYYEEEIARFNDTMNELLGEDDALSK